MKSEFKITNEADSTEAEVFIYGDIGDSFWSDGITAQDFVDQLNAMPPNVDTIRVRINSYGGDVFAGYTMHSVLRAHKAKIITEIDGLAASSASIVAMAGDTIRMGAVSMMMIHRASSLVHGNADDMRDEAEVLGKIDGQIAQIYSRRSGQSMDAVKAMLAEPETWFTPDEAVEAGFADEIAEQLQTAARWEPGRFKNAPALPSLPETLGTYQSDKPLRGATPQARKPHWKLAASMRALELARRTVATE